tara:strand:- start:4183 stop:5514 length:1332 start_codon:yes stop_codon:yes gene_type:complete
MDNNIIKKFENKFVYIKDKSHHILKHGIYEFVVFENFINIYNKNRLKIVQYKSNYRKKREVYYENKHKNLLFLDKSPFNINNDKTNLLRFSINSFYHNECNYLNYKKRYNKIFEDLYQYKKWNFKGKYILIILNNCKTCGYSMKNECIFTWLNDIILQIRKTGCTKKILIKNKCINDSCIKKKTKSSFIVEHYDNFKIHDPSSNFEIIENKNDDKNTMRNKLEDYLNEDCYCAICYSSTACVKTILAGIPTYCESKNALAYELSFDLKNINNLKDEITNNEKYNQEKFLNNISNQLFYRQELFTDKFINDVINTNNIYDKMGIYIKNKKLFYVEDFNNIDVDKSIILIINLDLIDENKKKIIDTYSENEKIIIYNDSNNIKNINFENIIYYFILDFIDSNNKKNYKNFIYLTKNKYKNIINLPIKDKIKILFKDYPIKNLIIK